MVKYEPVMLMVFMVLLVVNTIMIICILASMPRDNNVQVSKITDEELYVQEMFEYYNESVSELEQRASELEKRANEIANQCAGTLVITTSEKQHNILLDKSHS